jgi:predicted metalloprotease with PDZ domain
MISPHALAIFCCLLASIPCLGQNLRYSIEIEPNEARKMHVSVDLDCYHSDRDTIYLGIPVQINQVTQLHKHYRNWRVMGGRVVAKDSHYVAIKVLDKKMESLKIHYEIFSPTPNGAVTRTNSPAPLIQPDYLHIRGYSLLLCPAHYKTFDVEVNWKSVPKGWVLQNSFSFNQKQQRFTSNNRDDWRRTNWVAGKFRQYQAKVFGKPVCFALRGNWNFEDTTLFNIIIRTVKTQRALWNDRDMDFYSVTLLPYNIPADADAWDKNSLSIGNGLFQSFVAYADENTLLADFIDLFNHEMMHEWIGGRINEGQAKDGIDLRWFVEGFTEYFALRNRWKAGFMTEKEFFDEFNKEYFANHYTSPYAETPNLAAEAQRWESYELDRLAYRRGCIVAFYFDMAIRQRSGGKKTLFMMMNDLMEYTYGTGRNLTDSYDFFVETLGEYYGEDPTQWLETYVEQGKKIPPTAFILPEYISVQNTIVEGIGGVPAARIKPTVKNGAELFLRE